MGNYVEYSVNGEKIYVSENSLQAFRQLDAVIFDCDGVLLKTDESYDEAIMETVDFFTSVISSGKISGFANREDIQAIRNVGGFNNDWELSYTLIMYFIVLCLKKCKEITFDTDDLREIADRIKLLEKLGKKLSACGVKFEDTVKMKTGNAYSFRNFLKELDETGFQSAEKVFKKWLNDNQIKVMESVKRILNFRGKLEQDVVTRVFQEIYLGSKLLTKFYGVAAFLGKEKGVIENETPIPKREILLRLLNLGIKKFGLATSRPRKEALYILNKYDLVEEIFNTDAMIFLEDIQSAEQELKTKLEKPHPYSILRSADNIAPQHALAYIGDTVADIIAAKKASNILKYPVLSIGVTGKNQELKKIFMKLKTDLISSTVNEFVKFLEKIKMD
ncbi:MAG: HAD family hydrolase [Candidatus Odinarchaeia archaeon]